MSSARPRPTLDRPDWWALWEIAHAQAGHFTTRDAKDCRISSALLSQNVRSEVVVGVERGIYRFKTFPLHPQASLVVRWLWTGREGIFSHETALSLHGLSDILPNFTVMSVPQSWARRRVRVPEGVELRPAAWSDAEVEWVGAVPATSPLRTVVDCAQVGVSRDLVDEAIAQGILRGMFTRARLREALRRVTPPRKGGGL